MKLSPKILQELAEHEGAVLEAYIDSVGVWTWSVGITNMSGHVVYPRYKDNPQTLERCLEVYEWVVRENYLPAVLKEFEGIQLKEHELGGALSFHYNTGAINRASWCDLWKSGDIAAARASFLSWKKPPEVGPRRDKEAALFFDGEWSQTGMLTVYPVSKPSYTPAWGSATKQKVDWEQPSEPPGNPMDDVEASLEIIIVEAESALEKLR